jgi:hypothetical protein
MKRFLVIVFVLALIAPLAYAQTSAKENLATKKTEVMSLMGNMSSMMQTMENLIPGKSVEQRKGISGDLKDMSILFKDMSTAIHKDKISDKELAAWNARVEKMQTKHLGSAQTAKNEGIKGAKKDVMVDILSRMSGMITNVSEVIQKDKDHVLIAQAMMDMSKVLHNMSSAVKKDKLPEKEVQHMLDRMEDIRAKINNM